MDVLVAFDANRGTNTTTTQHGNHGDIWCRVNWYTFLLKYFCVLTAQGSNRIFILSPAGIWLADRKGKTNIFCDWLIPFSLKKDWCWLVHGKIPPSNQISYQWRNITACWLAKGNGPSTSLLKTDQSAATVGCWYRSVRDIYNPTTTHNCHLFCFACQ